MRIRLLASTHSPLFGWCRTTCMIRPGGNRGLCRVRAMLESLGTMVCARARSLSRWYSLMQPPASKLAADVGVEPQPQHITEHAIVFHWNNSRTNRPFSYRSRRDKTLVRLDSELVFRTLGSTLLFIALMRSALRLSICRSPILGTTSLPTTTEVMNSCVYCWAGILNSPPGGPNEKHIRSG